MATRKKTEFKVKQQIVYPSQGVGVITEIFEKEFNGEKTLYYKIYVEVSDMVVMVPVNNAKNLGIRAIVEAKEAKKALNLLGEDFEPITSDWKLRYQMNLDLLKKGTIADIAKIGICGLMAVGHRRPDDFRMRGAGEVQKLVDLVRGDV